MDQTDRFPKYWICDVCATAKGWYVPAGAVNTVSSGLCGWCDSEKEDTLTPVVDFVRNGKQPWFD